MSIHTYITFMNKTHVDDEQSRAYKCDTHMHNNTSHHTRIKMNLLNFQEDIFAFQLDMHNEHYTHMSSHTHKFVYKSS